MLEPPSVTWRGVSVKSQPGCLLECGENRAAWNGADQRPPAFTNDLQMCSLRSAAAIPRQRYPTPHPPHKSPDSI